MWKAPAALILIAKVRGLCHGLRICLHRTGRPALAPQAPPQGMDRNLAHSSTESIIGWALARSPLVVMRNSDLAAICSLKGRPGTRIQPLQ